ncbi:MAG: hypothetical protein EAZ95_14240 [Bacteroidetes bacterium]|nr:MAG: hypothetical protein EAZ95_14240 [Bacteroidota bacterium]
MRVYQLVGDTFVPILQVTGRVIYIYFGRSVDDERVLYCFNTINNMTELLCEEDKITVKRTVEFPPEIQSWDNTTADAHNNLWTAIPEDSTGKFIRLYSIREHKIIKYFYRKDFPKLPAYHPNQRMRVEMHTDFDKQILCNVNGYNYRYDEKQERFVPVPYYLRKYNLPDSAYYQFSGNIKKRDYMVSMTKDFAWRFLVVPQSDGSYKIDSIPNKYFNENGYSVLLHDHNKRAMWFSGQDALYKYNANIKSTYNRNFPTYLRAVYPLYNPDSLSVHEIFGANPNSYWQLPYQQNKLRFEFSAVDFSSKGDIQYRYFLEGNDAQWSGWTAESYKEYTNLPEGVYTFHVQAINHYGFVGQPASFTFTILAPWYRTWWAYTLYAVVAGLLLYALIYLNLRRLRQYNEYLTRLVRERTKEIEEQNQEILAQAEELRQFNDEILAHKEEIEAQRDLLEKQNHEVMDSITYGSRIQNAILPFRDRIEKTLDEHFVLFQPRDVVSGDFYWFHDTNPEDRKVGKAIIAVADCTGHGVPGAFMSMIGNQILYELVIQKHCEDSDIILNMLHKEVRRTLRQYETENRDGMDIGMVVWDKEKHLLEFSGAKNTLVYFLQGEMQTIRGDKISIGGEQREQERIFTKNIINLPTNGEKLTFYLYSDGFQDQFGGANNKKFSPQRMRDLFQQIHTLPMAEQEYTLLHTITQWRNEGQERQTDDILVWGTRL